MSELFTDIPPTLSPRLKWMAEHGINVIDNGSHLKPGDEDEGGWRIRRYCAHEMGMSGPWPPNRAGWGDTEEEACADLAIKIGLRLWNESPGALSSQPTSEPLTAKPSND